MLCCFDFRLGLTYLLWLCIFVSCCSRLLPFAVICFCCVLFVGGRVCGCRCVLRVVCCSVLLLLFVVGCLLIVVVCRLSCVVRWLLVSCVVACECPFSVLFVICRWFCAVGVSGLSLRFAVVRCLCLFVVVCRCLLLVVACMLLVALCCWLFGCCLLCVIDVAVLFLCV